MTCSFFVSFMLYLLGDFQVVVAVLGSYFPKDYTKKYRKYYHICLPEKNDLLILNL